MRSSAVISPDPYVLKYASNILHVRDQSYHLSVPHFFISKEQIEMLPCLKEINTVN